MDRAPLSARRGTSFSLGTLLADRPLSVAEMMSDAATLPKTTNMRRPTILPPNTVVRAPLARYQGGGHDDTDEDSERKPSRGPIEMLHTIPCLPVASLELAMNFYAKALGFVRRGLPHAKQVRMVRGGKAPRMGPRGMFVSSTPGVHVILRVEEGMRPTRIWIVVHNADALFDEIAAKLQHYSLTMRDYFPLENFLQARIEEKPHNTAWGTREFRVVDPDENVLVFCEERL